MPNTPASQQAFEDLLMLFADFFAFPDQEFWAHVQTGAIDQEIMELSGLAGVPVETDLKSVVPTYEEWITAYNHCFLGTQKPFAPPIESIYKQWTVDESFQVPFKHQKGYLMGDCAQHVRHILDSFGLEIPVEYHMMPDHLIILLELLAFLLRSGFPQEAQQFIRDHLDWLPDLRRAIEDLPVDGKLYLEVLVALEKVLQTFQESLITEPVN